MLGIGLLCISFSAIFVKLAGINGLSAAFYRVTIAGLVLFPVFVLKCKKKFQVKEIVPAVLCGVFFATDVSLWHVSIMQTDASVATLLGNLAPLWTGILGYFFYKIKPSKYYWLGLFVAMNGVVMLLGYSEVLRFEVNTGFFLSIAASVFYALYILTSNVVRQRIDTLSFMMFTIAGSVGASFVYCIVMGAPLWGFSTQTWLSLTGMGIVSHTMGWMAINYALGYIPSTEASIVLLSQSVLTALLASIILGEVLAYYQITGGVIVLLGIVIVYMKRSRPQPSAAAANEM